MKVLPHARWKPFALLVLVALIASSLFAVAQRPMRSAHANTTHHAATSTYNVLFDNAHAETAGNADWIISSSQPDPLKENPNPQAVTDWTGGISSWGVTLQKTGRYSLMTNTSAITYGNAGNPLDLSKYNELVLPEPNTLFTTGEKTAILTFVRNGGGLFMVADHNGSDRNNDGSDSLHIFNDLMNNGGVGNDPFGITFDVANIAKDYPSVDTPNPDPILQGPFGTGTTSLINRGTTETINRTDNPNVVGVVYITGASNTGTTGAFISRSTYGSGRVIATGDSSAIDDGTCQPNNNCFNGWGDPKAQNGILYPNGTEWLASGSTSTPTPTATVSTTVTVTATTIPATATPVPPSPTVAATDTPIPSPTDTPTPAPIGTPSCTFWWFCF